MHNIDFFKKKAKEIRYQTFKKFCEVRQGHPGSIFSMIDIAVALYYGGYINIDSENNKINEKVIISKGHAASCLYPILVDKKIIPKNEWDNWGKNKNSILRMFGNTSIPGIDATSGSLGHGLGIGAGYAYSFKKRNIDTKVFVVISEGELYEGSIWETLLFINHHNLNNLHLIIDRNNLMILGNTEDCLKLEPMQEKIESFGLETKTIDGHSFNDLLSTFDEFYKINKKSNCIIANTTKGKGILEFENNPKWHYWTDIPEELENKILEDLL